MTASTLTLRIVTPSATVLEAEVNGVRFPGEDGSFGVLPRHATMLSLTESGLIVGRMTTGEEVSYLVHDGFAEVRDNVLTILTRSAEKPGEIDMDRARAASERARERLSARKSDLDATRAEAALRRSLMRMNTTSK